ncbi:MAG: alpha/beta hydrolase [Pseudomonadota bacterium]
MIPLVFVHGFMGGGQQWDALAASLGKEREIIALDLPGFGANAGLEPLDRIEQFAAWVIEQTLQRGVLRYHLLGHSMGGMIAQEIARRDPTAVERLVLYATGPVGDIPGRFETMAESRHRAQTDGAKATATRIAATWLRDGEDSHAFPTVAQIASSAALPALLAGLTAMEHWSGRSALHHIAAPTLIIWGEHDRSYNWAQINELWTTIPGASLCVLPNSCHLAHLEEPDLFASVLSRFLSDAQRIEISAR